MPLRPSLAARRLVSSISHRSVNLIASSQVQAQRSLSLQVQPSPTQHSLPSPLYLADPRLHKRSRMATFAVDESLKDLFRTTTSSEDASHLRVILVQTSASGKTLELVNQLPPESSDKEDFSPLLGKLFNKEPTRSGYALYRLDSQSASGQWEWLCIAYQPDGAKVREKMQYSTTRASLMAGLSEQYFLETIFATGPSDFRFPTKLRNARKADYQNPQGKTAGKSAAEAAGTDAGGARRNFGVFRGAAASSSPSVSPATPVNGSEPASQINEPTSQSAATDSALPQASGASVSQDAQQQAKEPEPQVSGETGQNVVSDASKATYSNAPLEGLAQVASAGDPQETLQKQQEHDRQEIDDPTVSIAPSAQADLPPTEQDGVEEAKEEADGEIAHLPTAGASTAASESSLPATDPTNAAVDAQALSESKAPEEPPTPAEVDAPQAQAVLSQPSVPSPEHAKRQVNDEQVPITKAKSQEELSKTAAAESKASSTAAATTTSSSTLGGGSSSSANGGSGSRSKERFATSKGIEWTTEAETALSGLRDRASGSAENNFVSLALATSTDASQAHEVQLRSPPRFVPPGDISDAAKTELEQDEAISVVFYRYPAEVEGTKAVFLYAQPPKNASSSLKNLYVNALDSIRGKAAQLTSLEVVREDVSAQYGPYPRPTEEQVEEISSRLRSIKTRITEATEQAGRSKPPRLVAVSKLHPPSSILAAYVHTQQLHFGENYVQEMLDKAKVLPPEINWHFVGGLQSNKGKALASMENLYLLETLDSIKAANILEKALASPDAVKRREPLRVYLQVNTSGEEEKSGLSPLSDGASPEGQPLFDLARHVITSCPHLLFQGLMTIGSAANSSASGSAAASDAGQAQEAALKANPDFGRLFETRSTLVSLLRSENVEPHADAQGNDSHPGYASLLSSSDPTGSLELSMGMTADFPTAIAAGSDNVRIGTACFGERPGSREEARKGMEEELQMDVQGGGATAATGGFARPKRPGGKK